MTTPTPSPNYRTGKICYIEMPAVDIAKSAQFYQQVFGWQVRQRDDGSAAFDDTTGGVSGTWVPGRSPSTDPAGLVVSMMVANAATTIEAIIAAGGEIVQPVNPDEHEVYALFRDPAGNILSIYQQPGLAELEAHQFDEAHTKEEAIAKEQLLQGFMEAYEHLIETASLAAQRGVTQGRNGWGPRQIVAHMAGWEVMASVRIPRIVAGMPPAEFTDRTQQTVMNDAINAALITLMGEQPLETLCGMLRQAYQRNVELLRSLEDTFFQPGEYVYERTKAVIEHCQEHMQQLVLPHP
jgi:predicted enzyme related to lactoylglutathione lyase